MTGATCQTLPAMLDCEPTGRRLRRHSDVNIGEVLLCELRLHFHLTALREAEESARTGTYDLSDLDVASEDQTGGWRNNIELADLSARSSSWACATLTWA